MVNESLKYIGNGQVRVAIKRKGEAAFKSYTKGDVIKRNDIPDDAFDFFITRSDFLYNKIDTNKDTKKPDKSEVLER